MAQAKKIYGWWSRWVAPLSKFSGLAIILNMIEASAVWPHDLLDIAMLPKADGDSTWVSAP